MNKLKFHNPELQKAYKECKPTLDKLYRKRKLQKNQAYITIGEKNAWCPQLQELIEVVTGRDTKENECIYFEKRGNAVRVIFDYTPMAD